MAFSSRAATSVGGGVRGVLRRLPSPPASTNIPIVATRAPIRALRSISQPCYRLPQANFQASAIHQESKLDQVPSLTQHGPGPSVWKIKMLYDGDCPLCMREVNMLQKRNEVYKAIKFVDISAKDYSPDDNQGIDFDTAMGKIHAIQSDGTVLTDVEAFRRLYEEVGLGWVYSITKYKPIAVLADAIYGIWAKYRLQITGRPSMVEIMESRRRHKI